MALDLGATKNSLVNQGVWNLRDRFKFPAEIANDVISLDVPMLTYAISDTLYLPPGISPTPYPVVEKGRTRNPAEHAAIRG